jgi:ATP-binding cassette, subfamily G (WHITE), member 2, PDR
LKYELTRISPDLVSAIASTGVSGRSVVCAANELAVMQPPAGQTCGEYLGGYASVAMGSIYNPNATSDCQYCPIRNADEYLAASSITYSTRWRNYGIGFAYIAFNIFAAVLLYYLFRVRKSSGKGFAERFGGLFKKNAAKEKKKLEEEKEKARRVPDGPILPK